MGSPQMQMAVRGGYVPSLALADGETRYLVPVTVGDELAAAGRYPRAGRYLVPGGVSSLGLVSSLKSCSRREPGYIEHPTRHIYWRSDWGENWYRLNSHVSMRLRWPSMSNQLWQAPSRLESRRRRATVPAKAILYPYLPPPTGRVGMVVAIQ